MNTTENNKLLAEFLGVKELITESQFLAMEHKAHSPTIIEYLSYHKDWNCLMLVVDKIYKLNTGDWTKIWFSFNGNINIEATYNACVKFVKWYNENKV